MSLGEGLEVVFGWVVFFFCPVESEGKGEGGGEGEGVGWGPAKEPASQCAHVCQNYGSLPFSKLPFSFSPKTVLSKQKPPVA